VLFWRTACGVALLVAARHDWVGCAATCAHKCICAHGLLWVQRVGGRRRASIGGQRRWVACASLLTSARHLRLQPRGPAAGWRLEIRIGHRSQNVPPSGQQEACSHNSNNNPPGSELVAQSRPRRAFSERRQAWSHEVGIRTVFSPNPRDKTGDQLPQRKFPPDSLCSCAVAGLASRSSAFAGRAGGAVDSRATSGRRRLSMSEGRPITARSATCCRREGACACRTAGHVFARQMG